MTKCTCMISRLNVKQSDFLQEEQLHAYRFAIPVSLPQVHAQKPSS